MTKYEALEAAKELEKKVSKLMSDVMNHNNKNQSIYLAKATSGLIKSHKSLVLLIEELKKELKDGNENA